MSGGRYTRNPSTDGEMLEVVDDEDRVLRLETRRNIHLGGLMHRAVHVILCDTRGHIVLQRRAFSKDHYGGWWDISVGGHVGPGESYRSAAIREIAEEMGIHNAIPVHAAVLSPCELNGWEHIHLFACRIGRDVSPDPTEIIDHRWVTVDEFLANASPDSAKAQWRTTPTSVASIRAWEQAGRPL